MHLRHGRPHRIRGWALIKARAARLPQRRYMRLIHYTLTVFDSSDEEADLVILEEVLVGAQVSCSKRRREITVKLPADRLIVTLRTDREYEAWLSAFRDAARVASHFYKIVTSRELGTGAFSTVYFGFDREDGHHVAIKVVNKIKCTRAELACAETEARMMAYLRHPSIVLCRDIFDAPDAMYVVMEYMSGATLEQRMITMSNQLNGINVNANITGGVGPVASVGTLMSISDELKLKSPYFKEEVAATIMGHVLSALAYLEGEGVCHRDVKPDNILLSTLTNDKLWATSARLSDFGLAAFVESNVELSDVVGTPHYVAPEVLSRDENDEFIGYGPPVDVWAAGVMMYWMLTGGLHPFDGEDLPAIFKAIRIGKFDLEDGDIWKTISKEAKSLLRGLLHPSPWIRLSASGATTHAWLLKSQGVVIQASYADRYKDRSIRRSDGHGMSARNRWRSAAFAVMIVHGFTESVSEMGSHGGTSSTTGGIGRKKGCERKRTMRTGGGKKSEKSKMAKAPERAPVGADGLGYNVGLIPSFTPKRRAKAGVTPTASSAIYGSGMGRESGSGGAGIGMGTGTGLGTGARTGTGAGTSKREKWFGAVAAGFAGFRYSGQGSGGDDDRGSRGASSVRMSKDSRRSVSSGTRTPSRERGGSVDIDEEKAMTNNNNVYNNINNNNTNKNLINSNSRNHMDNNSSSNNSNNNKRGMSIERRRVGSVDRKSVGSSGTTLSSVAWAFLVRGRTQQQQGNNGDFQ